MENSPRLNEEHESLVDATVETTAASANVGLTPELSVFQKSSPVRAIGDGAIKYYISSSKVQPIRMGRRPSGVNNRHG